MRYVCQGAALLLCLFLPLGFVTIGKEPAQALREQKGSELIAHVRLLPPGDFRSLRLAYPELAACLVLAGTGLPARSGAVEVPPSDRLAAALAQQLAVVGAEASELEVFYAFAPQPSPKGVGFGRTVLLLLPSATAVEAGEAARVAAVAWLASQHRRAAPVPGVSEVLVQLAESLAWLGSFALASTPAELLPVSSWQDRRAASEALQRLVESALDSREPFIRRRALLQELLRPGRTSPETAQAAAFLLEAFGQPARARQAPMELLGAWAEAADRRYPKAPRALLRALTKPAEAGQPAKPTRQDTEALRWEEALRHAWAGPLQEPLPAHAPADALRVWQARRRAAGLAAEPPVDLQPGKGFCLARPESPGFAVYWRHGSREELLLLWPHWVALPQLDPSGGELVFVDPQGVWRLPLAGGERRQVLAGNYRAVAATEEAVAALAWPGQELVIQPSGKRVASAAGGFTWITPELLAVSDGDQLALVTAQGERQELMGLSCCAGLAAGMRGSLWAALGAPCGPRLVRVDLAQRQVVPGLSLQELPADLLLLPQGDLALVASQGLFTLVGERAQRQGLAFSIGPG